MSPPRLALPALAGLMAALSLGCWTSPNLQAGPDAGSSSEDEIDGGAVPVLGKGERRFVVVVLPGDAAVEIDGVALRRRDGLIELAGKVGQVRRLRVSRGAQSVEKEVTLQEAGASPALIDLNARPPRPTGGGAGPKPSDLPPGPPGLPPLPLPPPPLFNPKFE
jgi:hypothetical protein